MQKIDLYDFADGCVRIRLNNKDEKNLGRTIQGIVRLVLQSVMCSGCGICVQQCPNKSINITEGFPRIDEEKCNHCKRCLERCPVLSYGLAERLMKSIPEKIADLSLEGSPKSI